MHRIRWSDTSGTRAPIEVSRDSLFDRWDLSNNEAVGNDSDDQQDKTALVVVAVAAFTGLRLSELRGSRWSDFDGTSLRVSRSVLENTYRSAKNRR